MPALIHPDLPLFIGLMSGTSADGIDAALVQFTDEGRCHFIHGLTCAWEADIRQTLLQLGQGAQAVDLDALGQLDVQVGIAFAACANRLLREAKVDAAQVNAIGSHGQTIRHRPTGAFPFTWQLGDPNRIAELTGITTVADFRRRDMAAGGQGAPLMSAFHRALLGNTDEDSAVLNVGGIANLTLLGRDGHVCGFDTGPANALLDAWCQQHQGTPFDANGSWAASGQIHKPLLTCLLDDPWFALPPPKSTGREHFHLDWVRSRFNVDHLPSADVQATLLELSAVTVSQALHAHLPNVQRALVCGGGVHNRHFIQRLCAHLPEVNVFSSLEIGIDPDYMEAMGFAWLARQTVLGLPGNAPSVTGAMGERILGAIYPGK